LADAIHRKSPRRDMPFVKVNCAAMVEELLMSELFGHEKGAFTGAIRERKGRFELAEGGTIFLDEIGDISPKCQVALLRVLQEREFERVGGTKTVRVDVRVICATNRDLEQMIARGEFRQDLYYRLKGVMLELPALRERVEDLQLLADHFLAKFARERGEEKKSLSPEALAVLQAYGWPGNIRELENVMSSASIFASGPLITPDAFEHVAELASLAARLEAPAAAAAVGAPSAAAVDADEEYDDEDDDAPPSSAVVPLDGEIDYFELARARNLSLKDLRQQVEIQCIRKALGEAKGNISEAARLLKMKRSRLSQIVNGDPLLRAAAKGE
ncbi:MAG: sigma 54-interacting transcriptional regulator, partial [Myxococcales bacterium]